MGVVVRRLADERPVGLCDTVVDQAGLDGQGQNYSVISGNSVLTNVSAKTLARSSRTGWLLTVGLGGAQ